MTSIHNCLLDQSNDRLVNGRTVGVRIGAAGYQCLWSERTMPVDTIVIHYISAVERLPGNPFDFDAIIQIFCDYAVSSHYCITREGELFRLVNESDKAWHCGKSIMPWPDMREGVNDFSIGIELVATEDSGYTDTQYAALIALCNDIEKRYLRYFNILGHEHVAGERAVRMGVRDDRKSDPGPLFRWSDVYSNLALK
jgi:AmpD protein